MKAYAKILQKVKLFENVEEENLKHMLSCLGARVVSVDKGCFLLLAGEPVEHMGIVLEGEAHVLKEDMEGERVIIGALAAGDFYGEALCCAGVKESPVSVLAVTDVKVMLLAFQRVLRTCPNSCLFHTQLIENMLYVIANKNIALQSRMDIISRKTLRMKVLAYLEALGAEQGKEITVPLDREEMADFLCVDRSALSHELSRMKKEGLIEYHKNRFRVVGAIDGKSRM